MLDLLREAMEAVPTGVQAQARWVSQRTQTVLLRNGHLEEVTDECSEGVGIRVLVGGAFAFAATRDVTAAGLRVALTRAMSVAHALPARAPQPLAQLERQPSGSWRSAWSIDPFELALEDKLALLEAAEAAVRGDPRIVRSEAESFAMRAVSAFASSEGGACTQERIECGGRIGAVAVADGELQVRSYPSAHGGSVAAAGWEHILELDLAGHAPRVAEEAVALLSAPRCPSGRATIVLGGEQVALQVHESIGHALELDRILLGELSYAGSSWVAAEDVGRLRYGSEQLNVVADATLPGGLGTFGWDDEGVAAAATPLIVEGVLRGVLSDRASAGAIGLARSGGCARADSFARQPIVRMTNVSLLAGEAGSLRELIADTDRGLLLDTNRSWSIDDQRLQFQFATEVAREIRDGELGRLYRNPSYGGVTPRFWASLDGVCSQEEWRMWGLLNCGKGEPGQETHVSHGAAPARFRDVQVGVA